MRLITVFLPEPYIKALDELKDRGFYGNRAQAIRAAVRDLINSEYFLLSYPTQNSQKTGV